VARWVLSLQILAPLTAPIFQKNSQVTIASPSVEAVADAQKVVAIWNARQADGRERCGSTPTVGAARRAGVRRLGAGPPGEVTWWRQTMHKHVEPVYAQLGRCLRCRNTAIATQPRSE
jgi:hypothetical protein